MDLSLSENQRLNKENFSLTNPLNFMDCDDYKNATNVTLSKQNKDDQSTVQRIVNRLSNLCYNAFLFSVFSFHLVSRFYFSFKTFIVTKRE